MSLREDVLESLADGVTVQDHDFTIIYQNRAMRRFFGDHVGDKCYEAYEHRPAVCEGCGLKSVMQTGQPRTLLRTAFEADGSTSFFENACSAVFDETGQIVAFIEVCRNVSQRLSLENGFKETNIQLGQLAAQLQVNVAERNAELARANHYLDEIINSLADPLFVRDDQGRYELVNRAFCELTGRSFGAVLGQSDFDLFPEREAQAFRTSDQLVLDTGEGSTSEEDVTTADGSLRTVVVRKTCLDEPSGRHIVGIVRDVTERKRLEAQLRQSQKMESIGMLAGGIAHDFNNLLTPILGGADLLLLEANDDQRVTLVREIRSAAERLKDLTRQLLAFGRKQVLELRQIDLRDVVRLFEPVLRRTIREDVRIQTMLPADPCPVLADASQLEQVLLNLAVNAQDAMPTGGILAIGVQDVVLDEEYAATHPDAHPGHHIQLSVSDTGCGMDAQTQARIFEPFFTTKAPGHGSGLGLATVYGIVRQQGGSVGVYSEPGRGSAFRIYLPLCRREDTVSAQASPVSVQTDAPRGQETILVVEDNDSVRKTTCRMLLRLGYHVLSADGPDACMEVVRNHVGRIDLLLTDVVLRESSGPEVYARLQAHGIHPKVVFMSGYTSNVIAHHGVLEEGMQFLQKPVSYADLGSKIRQVLDAT